MTTGTEENPGAEPVRVLIADDHRYSRNGLRALLDTTGRVAIVGEAVDGREAIRQIETCCPDVVLMDLQMPVMDGLEATRQAKRRWPEVKIILLTMYDSRQVEAIVAGADAFLVKGCPVNTLLETIFTLDKKPPAAHS